MRSHLFMAIFIATALSGTSAATSFPASSSEKIIKEAPSLNAPQGFIENKGQILGYDHLPHPEVTFAFQQGATRIFLLKTGIAYQFTKTYYPEGYDAAMNDRSLSGSEKLRALQKQIRTETYRMDMVLSQANASALISSEGQSEDVINYYNHGVVNVHHYNKITYHNMYPGIDWVIYARNGKLKYDFVVSPGADPALIQLSFKNQEALSLNADGSFTLKNKMGSITEKAPVSYQQGKEIKTAFAMDGSSLSFGLTNYNSSQPLTIDPSLSWATYYGSATSDVGSSCTTDASGNVYLAGSTISSLSIASGGYQNTFGGGSDAFLVKFTSSGTRLWATYYGGTGNETNQSCTTDASGNVFLAGSTTSSLNIASGGHQNTYGAGNADGYLVKFNSSGTRLWATYYGDAGNDDAYSCTTDASGNVYMAGTASSTVGIASGGYQNTFGGSGADAFLVKFNSSGVRQWGTYYGDSNIDLGNSCATDASGNVYLAGMSNSSVNIASPGSHQTTFYGYDAFLAKFNSTGVRQWATYYGGMGYDTGYGCATDASGNIFLAGLAISPGNIASGGFQNTYGGATSSTNGLGDAFLSKFNSSGVRQWGTYYGGAGDENCYYCATDPSGNVYIAGATTSTANIASGGYQNTYGGTSSSGFPGDAFIAGFSSSGARLWGSYFGGAGQEYGLACTTDASGSVYMAGYSGSAGLGSGGYQNTFGGVTDAFLLRFCSTLLLPSAISGNTLVCASENNTYSVAPVAGASGYTWTLPGGWTGSSSTNTIAVTAGAGGTLGVAATNTCGAGTAQTISITSNPIPSISVSSGTICAGQNFTVTASGASTYIYSGGSVVSPSTSTSYSVMGTSTAGCTSTAAAVFTVTVNDVPIITASSGSLCSGQSFTFVPSGASTYTYSGGSAVISPTANTSYSITGTSTAGCTSTAAAVFTIAVVSMPTISINASTTLICQGEAITLTLSGADAYSLSTGSGGSTNTYVVVPPATGSYSISGSNSGCTTTTLLALTVDVCTGVEELHNAKGGFSVYPNPNTGRFTITSANAENATLSLYNLLGEKLMDAPPSGQAQYEQHIDIGHLADGMYLLVIRRQDKTTSLVRIVKE